MHITKESLLKDIERLEEKMAELAMVESELELLKELYSIRFGNSPHDENVPKGAGKLIFSVKKGPPPKLDYDREIRNWAAENLGKELTTTDFREWLEARFRGDHRSFIATPIRHLIDEGVLIVTEKGEGRRPSKYKIMKKSLL